MNSIKFPKMFTTSSTEVVNDYDATLQDLKLLLSSEKGELFGDPFFGVRIKKYMFNQNNYVLRDILIDELFTQIQVFSPQLSLTRNDIKIEQKGNSLVAKIKAINKLDFKTNMFELELFNNSK